MTEIVNYITSNYVWFLGGIIVILLAIIGNYADKTNFGQTKIKKEEKNKKEENLDSEENPIEEEVPSENIDVPTPETLEEIQNELSETSNEEGNLDIDNASDDELILDKSSELEENTLEDTANEEQNLEDSQIDWYDMGSETLQETQNEEEENLQSEIEIEENERPNIDEEFDKLDEFFSSVVPEEEVIDNRLLDDIEDLSVEDNSEEKITDIPDLDDVELPRIGDMSTKDKNVWKF